MSSSSRRPSAAAAAADVVQDTNFVLPPSDAAHSNGGYGSAPIPAVAAAQTSKPTSTTSRALAPDLLRGLILPLMSLDHAALFLGAWLHGTPKQSESAGTPFTRWNFTTAYISRTITHLCAPGFFFLMGMGCVYFQRSRAKIGWSKTRMAKHFVVRAVALTLVSEVLGESLMWGRRIWIINIVLIGLAVDYLLTGLLCLAVDSTEGVLAEQLDGWSGRAATSGSDDETRPLLSNGVGEAQHDATVASASSQSKCISFWIHNAVLLLLTYITIFWNIWLSPTGGHCSPATSTTSSLASQLPIELLALTSTTTAIDQPPPAVPPSSRLGPWFDFWFFPVQNQYVMSGFPPLAWISFCLFGLLYARVMLYKRWTPQAVATWNVGVSIVLAALFVGTRLLHFGNLSEGCLQIVGDGAVSAAKGNQYLVSVKSFFYITKYPPSPSFFFFTMSVNFALLAVFSAIPPTVATSIPGLMNYGGSALFFYVAHMYLYFLLAVPARYFFEHELPDKPPNAWERTTGLGNTAPFWIIWILGLFILSPMCRAYGRFKSKQSADSIWRFF